MSELRAAHIGVRLGPRPVLDDVCVQFRCGEVTAIVGPNGAGKSTFLACLSGLRKPMVGEVLLDGEPVLSLPARTRAARIGLIPQNPEVAWAIDVLTLVRLGRIPYSGIAGLSAIDHFAVQKAIRMTAIELLADRDITTLSGGERTRVILARALAGEPQWLLADEPFTGLDPRHQLEAAEIFRNMAHVDGKGVIVTMHDLSLAARLADSIILLADGKIVASGSPEMALAPDVLAQAYGVRTHMTEGAAGPLVEILGLCD